MSTTTAKTTKPLNPCGCGCGGTTPRRFRPGHDARIPLGAACKADPECGHVATVAVGKIPACNIHTAMAIRASATPVRCRPLTVLAVSPEPAPTASPKPRRPRQPRQAKAA